MTQPALWLLTILAAPTLLWLAQVWKESRQSGPQMLLYHRLVDDEDSRTGSEALFSIATGNFEAHLTALLNAGYSFVSMESAMGWLAGKQDLPPKSLLLCFDDGCVSVHSHAFPLLQQKEISATVFVTTREDAFVFHLPENPQRRLSSQELNDLSRAGWTLGVHGTDHGAPNALSETELQADFKESLQTLCDLTGVKAIHYAIPGNFDAPHLHQVAQNCGIQVTWSARPGTLQPTRNPTGLPRYNVEGTASPAQLLASLTPAGRVNRQWIAGLKRLPARLLGPKIWLPLRRKIFASPIGSHLTMVFWTRLLVGSAFPILSLTILRLWNS